MTSMITKFLIDKEPRAVTNIHTSDKKPLIDDTIDT